MPASALNPALSILTPLLSALALTLTAWVAGRRLTRGLVPERAPEREALSIALGFAVLAQAALILGLCGVLRRGPWIAVLVAVHVLGVGGWRELARAARSWWRPRIVVLGLLAVVPLAVLAFYPATAFDATMYHLPYVRAFVRTGGMPFLPDLRYPVFPQLDELLMAGTFLLAGGETVGQLLHLAMTLATAGLAGVWGRQAFSVAGGWLGAALFLGSPLVVGLAATAYVEPALALFVTAALYAAWRWRESGRVGWLALAAFLAGSAAGVKYLGLFFVLALLVEAALASWRERTPRDLLLFTLIVTAILAPTYARILGYTGNPVFPFFARVFGASPWDARHMLEQAPLSERILASLRLPWDAIFHRAAAGGAAPLSPVYLLGIPLLFWGALRDERARYPVLLTAAYGLIFLVVAPDVRYFAAALPMLSVVLGGLSADLLEEVPAFQRRQDRSLAAVALVLFLPGWLYAGYRVTRQGAVPLTPAARQRYLAASLPVYPAIAWLNRTRGRGYSVYALHAENMPWFAAGRFQGDWNGLASFGTVEPLLAEPEALYRRLRGLRVTHLLIAREKGPDLPVTRDSRRLFRPVYRDDNAVIYELAASRRPGSSPR